MPGTARAAPVGFLHGFRQRAKMPLAKVAGGVTLFLEQLRQRQLLWFYVAAVGERNSIAIRMAPRYAAPARRAANRRRGIKPIELQAAFGHCVEVWRLDDLVSVKTNITPSQIIGHEENDVGLLSGKATGQSQDKKKGTKKPAHAGDDRRETYCWQKPFDDRCWAQ